MRTRILPFIILAVSVLSCELLPEEVAVDSITLDQSSVELIIGKSLQLSATINPFNATDTLVSWSSSNQDVAMVSSSGLVYAISEGKSTITASINQKSATCLIVVTNGIVDVSFVLLNEHSLSLVKGDSKALIASVYPDNATDKTVTWTSSNPNVASVDDNGTVVALTNGNTTITAKAGEEEDVCDVTVTVPVENVTLNKTSIDLIVGASQSLIATVLPKDATDKTVIWTSSNPDIASVDANGRVTGIAAGSTTITAKASGKEAVCDVIVSVPVESVVINQSSLSLLKGESFTLSVTITPDDATNKSVIWESSKPDIAIVDNGVVTGINVGNATISATAGGIKASCNVLVLVDSSEGVSAHHTGGSYTMTGGLIHYQSLLYYRMDNYSSETIQVVSVQLIDGETWNEGNVLQIGNNLDSGSSASWSIRIGLAGIHSPIARFVYTFKGESYTCEAKFNNPFGGLF